MSTGLKPVWAGRNMRLDPFRLPQVVSYATYDDFGDGQARLQELADAPPDIVKFDIALVRGLDKAPRPRVEMVQLLVHIVHCMGVKALAEGVAEPAEAKACVDLGFDLLQGFHFGRPQALDATQPH